MTLNFNGYCREIIKPLKMKNGFILRLVKDVIIQEQGRFCQNSSFTHKIQFFYITLPRPSPLIKVVIPTTKTMKFKIIVLWFAVKKKLEKF